MPQRSSPDTGQRPHALILTTYGLYARDFGGWISVTALIALMAQLGVDESAARSAVSRLKRKGILTSERRGAVAGYLLSEAGRVLLDAGDRRIFDRRRASSEDGWVLAVFSVPESERHRRHRLRTQLSWFGFGTVAAGVWIAPGHIDQEVRAALAGDDLHRYVELFRAQYDNGAALRSRIGTWWDLPGLSAMYEGFIAEHLPMLRTWRRRRIIDGAAAYADYARSLTAWRRLPDHDPGIPLELLPRGWQGAKAVDLFADIRELLHAPARVFADTVIAPMVSGSR